MWKTYMKIEGVIVVYQQFNIIESTLFIDSGINVNSIVIYLIPKDSQV